MGSGRRRRRTDAPDYVSNRDAEMMGLHAKIKLVVDASSVLFRFIASRKE
jgi:hypothetical protein